MANRESALLTHQRQPLLLSAEAIVLEPNKPENQSEQERVGKVVLECPRCCWIFEVKRPDSRHPDCSFNKPETSKIRGLVEEPRVCRNPKCKKQFTIYWHKTAASRSN
jgi:hypothetical protein